MPPLFAPPLPETVPSPPTPPIPAEAPPVLAPPLPAIAPIPAPPPAGTAFPPLPLLAPLPAIKPFASMPALAESVMEDAGSPLTQAVTESSAAHAATAATSSERRVRREVLVPESFCIALVEGQVRRIT